ncbi:MAG TPA: hypothetical protein VKF14_15345 [Candidatus Dormibacteraeota bacterium]|nr:hypothetical protein [Candidatus Dormibacteraeota bacterium]
MTLYSVALFLHILGALLLFTALSLEGIGLRQMRRASTPDQVRDAAGIAGLARIVGPASLVGIAVPGLYMTATTWGWVPWIVIGLASWLLVGVTGAVNGIRLASIGRAAGGQPLSAELSARIGDPLLVTLWLMRSAIVLAVVFLMTIKPGTAAALLVVVAAAAIGLFASLPTWRRGRASDRSHADVSTDSRSA